MSKKVFSQIKQRSDTQNNWTVKNPILAIGEFGVDTTNKKIKIGDGSTTWNSLEYIDDNVVEQLGLKLDKNGDGSELKIIFSESSVRSNINTGEKLSVILGKVKRFFSDLHSVAFSGDYRELNNKPTSLPANGGNADTISGFTVGTNVPSNAKFTDTNTTYREITTAEIDTGTASTLRVITGRRIKYILDKVSSMVSTAISSLTKNDVGLGNVDNIQQATKSEFNSHNADSTRHITSSERTKWNTVDNKVDKVTGKQLSTEDYTATEKSKLSGIETGANKYTHPSTHPYSMITGTPTSLPANGGQSTTTNHLVGDDTRSVNSPPSVYMSSGSRWAGKAGWQTEFKNRSTIGSPSSLSGTYVYLQTHTPWSDPSGGYPVQIAYGNGTPSWRVGISNSTWSDWESFNDNGNAATVNGKTVLTNVPSGAKFTDTIYTHPTTHPASMITGLPTTLPASGGNADSADAIKWGTF